MPTESPLFDFHWNVAQCGYRWDKTTVHPSSEEEPPGPRLQQVLHEDAAPGSHYLIRQYAPLRQFTGLFRTFAETALTPEAIRAFANEYGLLGISVFTGLDRSHPVLGERLSEWRKQILLFRRPFEVWELVRRRDSRQLACFFRWEQTPAGRGVTYEFPWDSQLGESLTPTDVPAEKGLIAAEHSHPEVMSYLKDQDLILPALIYVQRKVNEQLIDKVAPRLLYDPNTGRLVFRMVPQTLIGALWLQFTQAISGNKELRQCGGCEKWFEVSPGPQMRTTRQFCSVACRLRAFRKRQQARELRAAGKSVRAIARTLGVEIEVIKKWLASGKD
jgi:hypothetical protein